MTLSANQVLEHVPHIDDLMRVLKSEIASGRCPPDYEGDFSFKVTSMWNENDIGLDFGFCLPHTHFPVGEEEVIVYHFENVDGGEIYASVEPFTSGLFPVMAYPMNGTYIPVAFAKDSNYKLNDIFLLSGPIDKEIGICSTVFSRLGPISLEETDVALRTQRIMSFDADHDKDTIRLVTMLFPPTGTTNNCSGWCQSRCVQNIFRDDHDIMAHYLIHPDRDPVRRT